MKKKLIYLICLLIIVIGSIAGIILVKADKDTDVTSGTIVTTEASSAPTETPTAEPTAESTQAPTTEPTAEPTEEPSAEPTTVSTEETTPESTTVPTEETTPESTAVPSEEPSAEPTAAPTEETTPESTAAPTKEPTPEPSAVPTEEPSPEPSEAPPIIVNSAIERSSATSDYKYGIKIVTITENTYLVYSDGTRKLFETYTYDTYDYSGYAATDAELMEESNALAEANIQYYNEVLALVNAIREEAGVHPLTLDTTLCQAATMRSLEMSYSRSFSHTRPNGSSCFSVLDSYSVDYSSAGENIAVGYPTPTDVVDGWKNSSGHYANMVSDSFNKIGVGMSKLQTGSNEYWTQIFTD